MIQHNFYTSGKKFLEELGDSNIMMNYVSKSFVTTNAAMLGGFPSDFALHVYSDADETVAIHHGTYPMFIAGSAFLADELTAAMREHDVYIDEVFGATHLVDVFRRSWEHKDILRKDMRVMERQKNSSAIKSYDIRWAEPSDMQALIPLVERFFDATGEELHGEDIPTVVAKRIPHMMVAIYKGEVSCCAHWARDTKDACCISGVVTKRGLTGRGLAASTVSALADHLQTKGRTPYLFVDAHNERAAHAYAIAGFVPTSNYSKIKFIY